MKKPGHHPGFSFEGHLINRVEPDTKSRYTGPKDAIIEKNIESERQSKDKK